MDTTDTPAARPRAKKGSTVVGWINRKIRKLDWPSVEAQLRGSASRERGVELCTASLESWSRYVASENQALASRVREWRDGTIYIVDLPGRLRGAMVEVVSAMAFATRTGGQYLKARTGGSADDAKPRLEPDVGFGPSELVDCYYWDWSEYQTLKVEMDVTSNSWVSLDEKADQWRQYAGVEYVLSIYLSPNLRTRQHRLDSVVNGELELPWPDVADIIGPATLVAFKSRRLLGLLGRERLPTGFPGPTVTIDLFGMVNRVVCVKRGAHANGA